MVMVRKLFIFIKKRGMKKGLFFFFIVITGLLHAQSYEDLVSELSGLLQTVTAGSKEYDQSVELTPKGNILYTLTQTDSKGRSKTTVYEFNFADIDPHTVRAAAQRDVMTVSMSTEKLQKLIKKQYDDEKISYINKLSFYAIDPDNGRKIAEQVKKIIPVARKLLEKRLSLSGYDDRINWLQSHTGMVEFPDKGVEQSLEKGKYPGSLIYQKDIAAAKSDKSYTYYFNLAFMDPRRVKFEIKGNMLTVRLETAHQKKLIKQVNNASGLNSFVNKVNIVAQDIEQARDMKKVLEDLIPLAKEKLDKKIPKISTLNEGYDLLNKIAANASTEKLEYAQSFEGNCIMKFHQAVTGNNITQENVYTFSLSDLHPQKAETAIKTGLLAVKIPVKNNKKFIKHIRDGVLQNYKDEIYVMVPAAEEGYMVQSLLKQMSEKCNAAKKDKKLSPSEAIEVLENTLNEVSIGNTVYEEEIKIDLDNRKLEFKKVVNDGRTTKEYLYEVSLDDLDPKSLEIIVSGKKVAVIAKTRHLEKNIKSYKDGKVQPYQNKMEIISGSIEDARKIKNALRTILKQ